jgi:hypothetical protein
MQNQQFPQQPFTNFTGVQPQQPQQPVMQQGQPVGAPQYPQQAMSQPSRGGVGTDNDFMPWGDTNEDEELPTGTFRARVIHAEDGQSQQSGRRMLRVGFSILEPAEYLNFSHFENYVIGSPEQPERFVPTERGARSFKKLCVKSAIPESSSIATLLNGLKNAEVMIAVRYNPESDFKNNVTNYFKLGERPAQVAPGTARGSGAPQGIPGAPQMTPPPQMAAPQPAYQQPQPMQQAPQPQMQAPQAPQPVQPPQMQPPQMPAGPAPVSAPQIGKMGQAVQQGPPASPAAPPQQGVPTMHCTLCQKDIPANEFGNHVGQHASGQLPITAQM